MWQKIADMAPWENSTAKQPFLKPVCTYRVSGGGPLLAQLLAIALTQRLHIDVHIELMQIVLDARRFVVLKVVLYRILVKKMN